MLQTKYRIGLLLLLVALVITALVSSLPSAGASTAGAPVWLPFAVKPANISAETPIPAPPTVPPTRTPRPTPTTSPDDGARLVASFLLPFNVLPGVSPEFVQDGDFIWYFTVYRIDAGDLNGAYVMRWSFGDPVATVVQRLEINATQPATDTTTLDTSAIAPLTPARGTLAHDYDRLTLYFFGFNDSINARRPAIDVYVINSFIP